MKKFLTLGGLAAFSDITLLALRLLVGGFLMWGTSDNIGSAERMAEFVAFQRQFGFPAPEILAPVSVWAQFVCGALIALGLLIRWAGLVMAAHFVIAVLMVHLGDDFRGQFPALVLIAASAHFAAAGAGRYSIDRLLG